MTERPEVTRMPEIDLETLRTIALEEARRRLTPSGDHEADDIAQSSVLEYLDYAAKNEVENPRGMICIIARRRAWKYRDKWEAKRANPVVDPIGGADEDARSRGVELAANIGDPVTALVEKREAQLVAYAVSQLDPVDREIAHLTYMSKTPLNAPEVAERLSLAAGTVRNRLVRIRRYLAELLEISPE